MQNWVCETIIGNITVVDGVFLHYSAFYFSFFSNQTYLYIPRVLRFSLYLNESTVLSLASDFLLSHCAQLRQNAMATLLVSCS